MPRALVAPDSFKGTFDAPTVAGALARGLQDAGWEADRCPVADGGEGTMALLVEALGGELVAVTATDPLGRPVDCHFGVLHGGTAIVEMAQASGLARVSPEERDAWHASTRGTGELVLAAVAAGAREILVAVGGSATTDGGAGAIAAIREGGGLGEATLAVLCDVESAFEDAPRIFGPQKGADPGMVARLEQRLSELAKTLPKDPRGVPGTGAAGGLSGGLWAAFDAELRPGAPAVLDALKVDERMRAAQLVIAGEGCIDEQSFGGKIVGELIRRAQAAGVPIHAVVGSSKLTEQEWRPAGLTRVWTASTLQEMTAAARELGQAVASARPWDLYVDIRAPLTAQQRSAAYEALEADERVSDAGCLGDEGSGDFAYMTVEALCPRDASATALEAVAAALERAGVPAAPISAGEVYDVDPHRLVWRPGG